MVKIIKLYNNFKIKNQHKNSIILIGNFDGLHVGHQKLFKELVKISKINNLLSVVLVFELRPREIINPSLSRPYIIPFEERIQNIKQRLYGVGQTNSRGRQMSVVM